MVFRSGSCCWSNFLFFRRMAFENFRVSVESDIDKFNAALLKRSSISMRLTERQLALDGSCDLTAKFMQSLAMNQSHRLSPPHLWVPNKHTCDIQHHPNVIRPDSSVVEYMLWVNQTLYVVLGSINKRCLGLDLSNSYIAKYYFDVCLALVRLQSGGLIDFVAADSEFVPSACQGNMPLDLGE
ncbi:hypothetical protein DL98DRAFT_644332 [Cadophora sp. DSE1049]|nr:hypothetical protein DL98DRAFT_644332 [Cadophora sp. DSE1049]